MAQKKKKKTTSTTSAATTGSNATKPIQSNDFFLQEYFNMSDLIQKWKTKQIEAVSVLGAFQIALLSCREELDQSQQNISKQNIRMDPLLLEELYTQVSEITPNFEEILAQMYQVYGKAHDLVKKHHSFDCQGLKLSPLDQFQMISTQIAMYEAEYQHVVKKFSA
jgi:hypothetical protein